MNIKIVSKADKLLSDYPEDVIAAYKILDKAESKVPQYEYEPHYKYRNDKAKKLFKAFSKLCEENNLKPVQTCWDLAILTKE